MSVIDRLRNLLSRKFLAPLIALGSLFVWESLLSAIPVHVYALFVGTVFTTFIGVEGIRDIMVAMHDSMKK